MLRYEKKTSYKTTLAIISKLPLVEVKDSSIVPEMFFFMLHMVVLGYEMSAIPEGLKHVKRQISWGKATNAPCRKEALHKDGAIFPLWYGNWLFFLST